MKILLVLPDPISYEYEESEKLKEWKKNKRLSFYPKGDSDKIYCTFNSSEFLLSSLKLIEYKEVAPYRPPPVIEMDVEDKKVPCVLWDIEVEDNFIKCEFHVVNTLND